MVTAAIEGFSSNFGDDGRNLTASIVNDLGRAIVTDLKPRVIMAASTSPLTRL